MEGVERLPKRVIRSLAVSQGCWCKTTVTDAYFLTASPRVMLDQANENVLVKGCHFRQYVKLRLMMLLLEDGVKVQRDPIG